MSLLVVKYFEMETQLTLVVTAQWTQRVSFVCPASKTHHTKTTGLYCSTLLLSNVINLYILPDIKSHLHLVGVAVIVVMLRPGSPTRGALTIKVAVKTKRPWLKHQNRY